MALRAAGTVAAALAASTALLAPGAAADDSCPQNKLSVSYPAPVAADGWSYRLVADGFTKPRGVVFDDDGGLLLIDAGAGLVHLALDDHGGDCVAAGKKTTLVDSADLNHGIALSEDGKTLYASTEDAVFAWNYSSSAVTVSSSNRTLVANMSNSDLTTRTLLLSRAQPGLLVVSRGSESDTDADAEQLSSGHAQIRSFNVSAVKPGDAAVEFLDGHVLGWGLRNSVGVGEHPVDGGVWSVENSVDALTRDGKDIHEDNPAEELNFHGYLNGSHSNEQGGNYGYPRCFTIWSTDNVPDAGALATGDQVPGGPDAGNETDKSCESDFVAPRLAFQAHMAPLDIKFTSDGSEAIVSFHGSWDSSDPVGYKISSIAFTDGQPTAKSDSMDAAVDILHTPDLSKCPDNCFRPVGLAWDKQGRLWFSSDSTGEIFVMQRSNSTSGGGGGDSGDGGGAGSHLLPTQSAALAVAFAAVLAGLFLA